MTIPVPLQESLRDSITSGTFVDTKFWVFSKRGSEVGHVGKPKELFVNGHVAERVPRLCYLLKERKTKENLRSRFPFNRKPYIIDYDYEDDSDLEGGEEDIPDDELIVTPQVAMEKLTDDSESVVVEKPDPKGGNESSDIISISDLDSLSSDPPDEKRGIKPISSAHTGTVVVIEDVAFITFQAFLRYLYTNEIEFAPWGSVERRKARALEATSESYGILKPSPKSVYRLADKYDMPGLKGLALRQIQQDLSRCNIAEEVFSKYTSWYPELRELELKQLARALLSSGSGPATMELLKERIKDYTHGRLPHAKHVISALYELMENDESVTETPIPAAAASDQQAIGGDWVGLRKALTSSLISGTFLDSQFYAVESRPSTGLPKIRPMYFCSIVGGDFTSKLIAYSSELGAQRPPLRRADEYDSDVDDGEPDQWGSMECYPRSKCVRECPTPPNLPAGPALLLTSGAAKTWSAIFLSVYTGWITFAAIGSQNATSKKEVQTGSSGDERKISLDQGGPGTPPPGAVTVEPCSPKSVYRLANEVGLIGLCDIAFKDIQSKLDENNIAQELFSPFTADHKDVREMEHELFRTKLKPLVDRALLPKLLEGSSSGEHPHRAPAIESVLERSIQDRRERMLAKAKSASQPGSTSKPEGSNETPKVATQRAKHPPAPPPQPVSQSYSFISYLTRHVPAPARNETPSGPSTVSQHEEKTEVERRQEPPADTQTNPPPSEPLVELVCMGCGVKQQRRALESGIHCVSCLKSSNFMRCVGCGTARVSDIKACTNCHVKFK